MATFEIERLNYFERQYLSWKDFLADQSYHIEMRRRHERSHHLWGIVFGLQITQDPNSKEWSVQPGMAVDAYGREMFVSAAEALDTAAIAGYLAGQNLPAQLKIWIAYDPEKSTPPAPGWQVCGAGTQYTRIDEGFQLLYKNVEDVFPQGDDPTKWPQVYNDLPDDPKTAPWPVYLGTLTWDGTSITNVVAPDPDKRDRRYIDIVAAEILAPARGIDGQGAGTIRMKSADLTLPDPLPTDPTKPGYAGISVEILGSLTVDRDVEIQGSLIVDHDAVADTLLTKSGHVVTKNADGGLYLDSGPATPTKSAGVWFMSDQTLGDDTNSAALMRLTDTGNLGIGTSTPVSVLEVKGDIALDQMAAGSAKTLPPGATMMWNDGSFLRLNENLDKTGLVSGVLIAGMLGIGTEKPNRPLSVGAAGANQELVSFQDASGNTLWHINQHFGTSALNFVETNVADGRLFLQAGGNVGVSTTTPRGTLDVNGSAWHTGRIGALNFSPDSGYPVGWGGGIHTWDLYAEGSVGAGASGALAAVIDRNGLGRFTTSVWVGPSIFTPVSWMNAGGDANFGGPVTVDRLLTPGQPDNGRGTVNCATLNCTTVNCFNINKTINNFRIDHPLKASKFLFHAAMEGPEHAVFYRGQAELEGGSVTIQLPDYFEALTQQGGRSVMLTPIYEGSTKISHLAASEIVDGHFTVVATNRLNPNQKFYWEVKAVRADVPDLVVEQPKPPAAAKSNPATEKVSQ